MTYVKILFLWLIGISALAQTVDQYKTTTAAGSVNVYTIPNSDFGAYRTNEKWLIDFTGVTTNSGAATLNRFNLGAKAIKMPDGTDPTAGVLIGRVPLSYNGTYFYIVGGAGSSGGGTVAHANNGAGLSGDTVQLGLSKLKYNTELIGYVKDGVTDFDITVYDSLGGSQLSVMNVGQNGVELQASNPSHSKLTDVQILQDSLYVRSKGEVTFHVGSSDIERFAINSAGDIIIKPNGITGTNGKVLTSDASGNASWQPASGGGTVTDITFTSPLTGGTITTTGTVSINNAVADGSTKGAASFETNDFNSTLGDISIDYTNGQAASGSLKGFLSSADWTTFNNKQASGNYITALTGDVTASGPGSASSTVTKINGTSLAGLATGILKNTTSTGVPSIAVAGDFPTLNQNTTGSAGSVANALSIGAELISGGTSSYNGSAAKTLGIQTGSVTNSMLAGSISDGNLATSYIKADGTRALSGNWASGQNITATALGIGTGSTMPSGGVFQTVETSTSTPRGVLFDQYNSGTQSSRAYFRKARGSFASPSVITTGDNLGNIVFSGHDGTSFNDAAQFLVMSEGTISTGIVQSNMSLQTANSSGTLTTGLKVDGSQIVSVPHYTTNGGILYTNGSGVISQTGAGTSTQLLHGGTSPAYSGVSLTADVTGTLPIANGGTNNGSLSTTQGVVYYGDGSKLVALAPGTSGQVLKTNGASANPSWNDDHLFMYSTSTYTLTSQTAAQDMFSSSHSSNSSNGLTVASGTVYEWTLFFGLNSMSTTSGTFGFQFAGTATITAYGFSGVSIKSGAGAAVTGQYYFQAQPTASIVETNLTSNNTSPNGSSTLHGIVVINAGGTFIPQISLTQASAGVMAVGCYLLLKPL